MPRDGTPAAPPRRRSRTVRAAALVTLGLGVTGCDDPPPDLPGQTAARLDACRAAHQRLGEDPARCDALEHAIAYEQSTGRPQFVSVAACEATFGRGACEGETLAAVPPNWRPALSGWVRDQGALQPVVQDRDGRYWALTEAVSQGANRPAAQAAPRSVPGPAEQLPATASFAYHRLAPIYPDEATCTAEWQRCDRSDVALPNRFATRDACVAAWAQCTEVELPDSALTMTVAEGTTVPATPGTSGSTGTHGGVRPIWWFGYNAGYRDTYSRGIGPRYQGWTWTADRRPTAAYRPATGTGPLQAWDSGSRRLGAAARMSSGPSYVGSSGSVSRPGSTISRAGFGSTGRSYSSGG